MRTVVDNFKRQKNKVGDKITPIFLYSIRYDEVSNSYLRFTGIGHEVTFDGITYVPFAISHGSIVENISGRVENVDLQLGNVSREMQYYLDNYDGLKGKQVSIKLVWKESLDDTECFIENVYYVESSMAEKDVVELTLKSALDVMDIQLPRRSFNRYYCQLKFKGSECKYSGAGQTCNKLFQRCEELGNLSRFGGFVGVPMKRMLES